MATTSDKKVFEWDYGESVFSMTHNGNKDIQTLGIIKCDSTRQFISYSKSIGVTKWYGFMSNSLHNQIKAVSYKQGESTTLKALKVEYINGQVMEYSVDNTPSTLSYITFGKPPNKNMIPVITVNATTNGLQISDVNWKEPTTRCVTKPLGSNGEPVEGGGGSAPTACPTCPEVTQCPECIQENQPRTQECPPEIKGSTSPCTRVEKNANGINAFISWGVLGIIAFVAFIIIIFVL